TLQGPPPPTLPTPKAQPRARSSPPTSSSAHAGTPSSSISASPKTPAQLCNEARPLKLAAPLLPRISSPPPAPLSALSPTCLRSKLLAKNSTPAAISFPLVQFSTKWPPACCPSPATPPPPASIPSCPRSQPLRRVRIPPS